MYSEEKDFIYLPKDLVEKIKKAENKKEIQEEMVLKYIEYLKKDISREIENLDEDVLMFKGKMIAYKKSLKEAYEEQEKTLYEMWEELDKKRSQHLKNNEKIKEEILSFKSEYEDLMDLSKKLSESFSSINTYHFEKIKEFLYSFNNMPEETKKMFVQMVSNRGQ